MRVGVDGRSLAGDARGVARYTAGMVAALAAEGVDVRVLVPAGTAVPAGVEAVGHRMPGRLLHLGGAVTGRPRLARRLGPVDIVWLPAPAPGAVGARYVLTLHDLSFLERPGDFTAYERLWHRLARPRTLARRAARVVAVSADTAQRVRARFGVQATVVPAGPGDPGPRTEPDTRFGRYFLFVGALEPRKGLDTLVAAHSGLEPALVLVGEGRLAARLRSAGAHVLGRVSRAEKAALYAGALAVVLPSWCEGYGYPPLEAYAHGTPAIVSDLPALRETAGAGARYVPRGDVAALRTAMTELADDAALRDRLGAAAADVVVPSWETCGRGLKAVLEAAAA